ncbi:hypothetical protein FALCPG4_015738 [Fusarium falciforme]
MHSLPWSTPPRPPCCLSTLDPAASSLPIYWTDLHTQLLGVRWKELPPCDTPRPIVSLGALPSMGHLDPSETITTLSNNLTQILLPDSMFSVATGAVKTVLKTLWPETFSKSPYPLKPHLYFGNFVAREALGAKLMWYFPSTEISSTLSPISSPTKLPMICYVNKA